MEFDLSAPQKLLQKSARDLFARACPLKKVRELMLHDIHIRFRHIISGPKDRVSRAQFPRFEHLHVLRVVRETQKDDGGSLKYFICKLLDDIGRRYLLGVRFYASRKSNVVGP